MKLGEIKLQALKMMKLDADAEFNMFELTGADNVADWIDSDEKEKIVAPLYLNPNTREKLIRMNDTINRGLMEYYEICEPPHEVQIVRLKESSKPHNTKIELQLNVAGGVFKYYHATSKTAIRIMRIDIMNENEDIIKENVTYRQFFTDSPWADSDIQIDEDKQVIGMRLEGLDRYVGYKAKVEYTYPPAYIKEDTSDTKNIWEKLIPHEIQMALPYYITSELSDIPEEQARAQSKWLQHLKLFRSRMETSTRKVKSIMRRG